MIRSISLILVLFWSSIANASHNNNNNLTDEYPEHIIGRIHAKRPIDFLGTAVEAAGMRALYNNGVVNVLTTETLSVADRFSYNMIIAPYDNIRCQQYRDNLKQNPSNSCKDNQLHFNYDKLRQEIATTSLAGHVEVKDKITPEEMILNERAIQISRTKDSWLFLLRSLQSYAKDPSNKSSAFINRLLEELYICYNRAGWVIRQLQDEIRQDEVMDKLLGDDVLYLKYILDCVMLHAKYNLGFSQRELPMTKLVSFVTTDGGIVDGGFGYYFLALSESLRSPYRRGQAECILTPARNSKINSLQTKKVSSISQLEKELIERGYLKDVHVDVLFRRNNGLKVGAELLGYAREFTLSPHCMTFRQYYQPILQAAGQKNRESFLVGCDLGKKRPVKAKRKKQNKGGRAAVPAVVEQEVARKPESIPVENAEVVVSPVKKEAVKKGPTEKQKREAKKAAEQEEFNRVIAERQLIADRNKQAQEQMIAAIQVTFVDELKPSIDELAIYSCLWGPDSVRRTLSWGMLRGQLRQYGWVIDNSGGSFVIMTPPTWFSHVKVTADAALGINFRNTKFMIHKPHDDALAPMPPYVIAFLREALGSAIGLSDVVVNAMIKKLGEKK